ncbi:MAG: aspartate carbamoyltransferase catalytic subunit [Verrucomicrobiota bacterium]
MSWTRKDLIQIQDLSRDELEMVLETTKAFKAILQRSIKKVPSLRGKTVVNLFIEPSTRTRASFELAAKRLSADVLSISQEASSFRKGETLKDTALTLQALNADFIIIRHSAAGAARFLADRLEAAVINAGDGAHEHPTQALLDVFTMRERFESMQGKHVVICGDILYSRVARSNIWALLKLGAQITLVGPKTLVPPVLMQMGVEVSYDLDSVLPDADVINLLRIQHERQRETLFPSLGEYIAIYGLGAKRFAKCKKDVLIMHPGPINRGVEIDSEIADGANSVVLNQVTNGLAVRMAILYLLSGSQSKLAEIEGLS